MTAHREGNVMVLVTGDSAPIDGWSEDRTWFSCPWCGTGQRADEHTCPNPACVASQWADEQYVRDVFTRLAAADAHREQARREAASLDRSREAGEAARQAAWDAVATEAAERGACLICLRGSPWEGGHPRYVRHRRADHHDRSAR
ncbi:hypothetical protein ACG83_10105 [Frankia sp. R43]|uniref:hypothetical protein n=1 Tax=Frankia sp. R43 TaxID=269536 RepID=UPI0006CA36D2|nr:hypothetical protein [Frankia sp. R43]KPM55636.1 hypothetical protein ACG83_10105 [Frankia sp. R43]